MPAVQSAMAAFAFRIRM